MKTNYSGGDRIGHSGKTLILPSATMATYTYKVADRCAIRADVYQARIGAFAAGRLRRPVVMAIHGGALIMAGRYPIQTDIFDPLLEKGFVIVSIDYRLAPETKLPLIIEDLQDAYRWIREKGPDLFDADPDRIGVQGCSAGGYLTLMTGFCVEPRPKVLVSHYGYGDIVGTWYSRPDPHYCKSPRVSKKEAYGCVGGTTVANGTIPGNRRYDFYLYCRQRGLWPREVAGIDPETDPEAFVPFCPLRNLTRDYPPTLLAHGDKDTDVPYQQSVLMDAALARYGVEHEFITLPGVGHGFCHIKAADHLKVVKRSVAFMVDHLGME